MTILARWASAVADWLSGLSADICATAAFAAFLAGLWGVFDFWWMLMIGGGLMFAAMLVWRLLLGVPDVPAEPEVDPDA